MLRDLFSLFPAYAGVIPRGPKMEKYDFPFPRIRGGDPICAAVSWCGSLLFPAYAGVILSRIDTR